MTTLETLVSRLGFPSATTTTTTTMGTGTKTTKTATPATPATEARTTTGGTRTRDTAAEAEAAFTERVASAAGPNANPRVAFVVASLVRHLHAFTREVDLTDDEWAAGVDFINRAGLLSTTRNETQLIGDIIGLESLVDHLTNNSRKPEPGPDPKSPTSSLFSASSRSDDTPTSSAILGPFYKESPQTRLAGDSIASARSNAAHPAETTRVQGRVLCAATGAPLSDATVDIWHAGPDGEYEGQGKPTSTLEPGELRGVFRTDADGRYDIYSLRPGPYPIPDDGPAGELIRLLDRSLWRPAHIHFKISAPGFRSLTTQLFDGTDPHLQRDTAFAVKDDLKVEFRPITDNPRAHFSVAYDFRLVPITT